MLEPVLWKFARLWNCWRTIEVLFFKQRLILLSLCFNSATILLTMETIWSTILCWMTIHHSNHTHTRDTLFWILCSKWSGECSAEKTRSFVSPRNFHNALSKLTLKTNTFKRIPWRIINTFREEGRGLVPQRVRYSSLAPTILSWYLHELCWLIIKQGLDRDVKSRSGDVQMSEMIVFDLQGCCGGAMLPIARLPIFLNKGW